MLRAQLMLRIRKTESGCWEWTGAVDEDGYGPVWFDGKKLRAHRVAAFLWLGLPIDGKVVRHSCDNPPCINPAHLLCGTQLQNLLDARDRGRKGALTRGQAVAAKMALLTRTPVVQIAQSLKVPERAIRDIEKGRTWKDVQAPLEAMLSL